MHVIIVGAGPSGLLLALLLARCPKSTSSSQITVTLLDAEKCVDERPRAAHYAPSAIRYLSRAGVLDDVRAKGFIPGDMTWRKPDGTRITGIKDVSQPSNPEAMTVLPLGMLGELLVEHCARENAIEIIWGRKVVNVGTEGEKAWVETENRETWQADYVIGCDGASSGVRRSLFGHSFPGKTWDAQIVATNVYYDLHARGYDDVNFIIHPEHYYMAAKITTDGMWRVSYGESTSLTRDQIIANQPAKYAAMLPGAPQPKDYRLLHVGQYKIHQRCAESFKVGRILLAADAAHLCNPFGGMGLTGGIVDVGSLAECLEGIANGVADDSILDIYSEVRKKKWVEIIDPISSSNFLRVSATDPETALVEDEFLAMVDKAGADEQLRKTLDAGVYDICHNFKQYWRAPDGTSNVNTHGFGGGANL